MSYNYSEIKPRIFTDEGQRLFLRVRDRTNALLKSAGAARLSEIMSTITGDTWDMLACVDRMIELGELRELTDADTFTQYRVFTKPYTDQ